MTKKEPKETTAAFQHRENVQVAARAIAGASAKVLDFPVDRGGVVLPLPPDLAKLAKKGAVDLVTLTGDSLEGIGLFDGDQVLCKTAFSKRDIKANTVCIVYVPKKNETFAKKVVFKDGSVILRSFNPNIADQVYGPEEVEIQGIVLNLLLGQDAAGRFCREPSAGRLSRSERGKRVAAAISLFQKEPEVEPF
jgi:phage repressor protein C with HTH and peptisase S24 domain